MRYFRVDETVSKVTEPLNFLSVESEFGHLKLMHDIHELDRDDLLVVVAAIHKQLLIKDNLFNKLLKWCNHQGVTLPPLEELLESM